MLNKVISFVKAAIDSALLPDWVGNDIIVMLLAAGIIFAIVKSIIYLFRWLIKQRNRHLLNRDLAPYYSPSDVNSVTQYYISTKFQNVAPSEDDEPGKRYTASAKEQLIPLLLKKVFAYGKVNNKYHLILADSGMGKTTLMINLYLAYKKQWRFIFGAPKYDIRLFPINNPNTFPEITHIADKKNTILLLDAFDEDIEAVKNYEQRLNEILKQVHLFRSVVITCRTQFFPSQKEEPHETGYFTGGEQGQYYFEKLYLSVFDEKDIRRYLRKRFSIIFQGKKYKKAVEITNKSPNLIIRPMLLNYISDLIASSVRYDFSFQIYSEMIRQWIIRESHKQSIIKKFRDAELFQRLLYSFSEKLAVNLYNNRVERKGYFISKDEIFEEGLLKLADIESGELQLTETEGKSKSLLNRNASGQYKFAHKSIMEFFLARELFRSPDFYETFDYTGMDLTRKFLREMIVWRLKGAEGYFVYFDPTGKWPGKEQKLEELRETTLHLVEGLHLKGSNQLPLQFIREFTGLKALALNRSFIPEDVHVSIVMIYNGLYEFYQFLTMLKKDAITLPQSADFAVLETAYTDNAQLEERVIRTILKIQALVLALRTLDFPFVYDMLSLAKLFSAFNFISISNKSKTEFSMVIHAANDPDHNNAMESRWRYLFSVREMHEALSELLSIYEHKYCFLESYAKIDVTIDIMVLVDKIKNKDSRLMNEFLLFDEHLRTLDHVSDSFERLSIAYDV